MNRNLFVPLLYLLALGMTPVISACNRHEPVKVGLVAGLTGRVADLGAAGRNGAMLAIEEKNAGGGVNGHPVELLVRDDEQNPETARQAVSELISKKVAAIIGPMTSSMAMATVPLVNDSPVIMVSPTVTTTDLAGKDDNFIRAISTTTVYATKSAHYQLARCGHRKIAAIYDLGNSAYTQSWLKDFSTVFEGMGGQVLRTVAFTSGKETSFHQLASELVAAKPDSILIISNAIDAALMSQQIRKLDANMPIVMAEWASTERFIELAGEASENVYVSQFLNRNDTSGRYLAFVKAYRERFGQEPGFAGMAGYDAAQIILEALARRQPGRSLKETVLAARTFQGVQQPITIDRFGEADRKTFTSVIKNGQYQTLE